MLGLAIAVAVASTGLMAAGDALAQKANLKVDWQDPEIKKYMDELRNNPGAAARAAAIDPRMVKLKLPVIGLGGAPSGAQSFGVSALPKPTVIMDESNPVWYSLTYEFGPDFKVTIEADQQVQHKLGPSTRLYKTDKGVDPDTEVSVYDDTSEVGMIGAIAQFKTYRFGNIPYTVTVECSEKSKALCKDKDALRKDRRLLKIISARPPSP
ncbi:MAG: hypothetical protein KDJ36_03470 [Hyphomicrobiaceae bacterium]|nr:hypothetical protein [Hyphomicrobiaceae bacterium]